MRFTQLTDWLTWLETLHPKAIDLGLQRVLSLAEILSLNQFSIPAIMVAGTNGKGSTIATLEAIYSAQGYQVAAYTSPHLLDFRERLRISQALCSEQQWCHAFSIIDQTRMQQAITLSYFEFTTLAALYLIQQHQQTLDVILLEVGLGGRLDAVNCVEPDISVITTIDLDHQDWLGHNRETIAKEKAGIFRRNKVIVCGDSQPPNSLLTHAQRLACPLACQGKDFHWQLADPYWHWHNEYQHYSNLPQPHIPLANVSTSLQVIDHLQKSLPVTEQAIRTGLQLVQLAGRWQIIDSIVPTILDVAHNPQAMTYLANRLAQTPIAGKTLAVVGMLADKAIEDCLVIIKEQIDYWYLTDLPPPRGALAVDLAKYLTSQNYQCFKTVDTTYQQALQDAQSNDRILVFGSFITVGHILAYGN